MERTALRDEPMPAARSFSWFKPAAPAEVDRLPLFEDAMGGVARALGEGLASLSASPGEVSYRGVRADKVDVLLGPGKPAVLAIAQASAWNTPIGLRFGQGFISAVVEAFFGGAGDDAPIPERDVLSPIESRIADVIAEQAVDALTAGFADVLPSHFALEPIRPKPDPGLLGKPGLPVLVATLVLSGPGRPAELDIVIPQAALLVFRDRLVSGPEATRSGPDPDWSERLEAEVSRATMQLRAHVELPAMRLGDIAGLRTGRVLGLPAGARSNVALSCGPDQLFRCELGQSAGFYTVRIEEPLADAGSPSRKHR